MTDKLIQHLRLQKLQPQYHDEGECNVDIKCGKKTSEGDEAKVNGHTRN